MKFEPLLYFFSLKKYYSFFLLFNSLITHSQYSVKGRIEFDKIGVPYALLHLSQSNTSMYTDSIGQFELKQVQPNDVLSVSCIGYDGKKMLLQQQTTPLVIELQKNSTTLDELVLYKIRSRWQSFFTKPKKPAYWPTVIGLIEGFSLIVAYKATHDFKFNGLSFLAKNDGIYVLKKVRPLIFKDSIAAHTALIENQVKTIVMPKNNSSTLKTPEYKIVFEFDQLIPIKKGDLLYIGLELLPNDITKLDLQNTMMLCPVKQSEIPELKTTLNAYLLNQEQNKEQFAETIFLEEDLYFELKIAY